MLPLYFTSEAETTARNDFLGRTHGGKGLTSFGVNPGGYVGFYDPKLGRHDMHYTKSDPRAESRMMAKGSAKKARRAMRRSGESPAQAVLKTARRLTPRGIKRSR